MPDKTPKEVATSVISQRARSTRIAGQTSPGPKLPKKANEPKSPPFTIVESTAPPSTADNTNTTSVVEQNPKSPEAREQDNATLPSKSKKDAVEDETDDANESTPPRARAVKKGVVM